MNPLRKFRTALAPLALLGLFACDVTDSSEASGRAPATTVVAPRVAMAKGGSPKATGFVRVSVREIATGIDHDSVYLYSKRQGRVGGIPVGASIRVSVVGFDSIVGATGQPEVVNRWAGVNTSTAQAVAPDMDSATVAATQPQVLANEPAALPVALPPSSTLPSGGGTITLPTAAGLGLTSAQEYRYALDVGDESKLVSVSAGSPRVPSDGTIAVSATCWMKVRVFTRDNATGLMLGTEGDSTLVHVPPPVPTGISIVAGDGIATIAWSPLEQGRVAVLYRLVGEAQWSSQVVDGAAGTLVLSGLPNGTGVEFVLRTVWGPEGVADSSSPTASLTVVPAASLPTAFGAGTWLGSDREPDSLQVGWLWRSTWILRGDGTFLQEQSGLVPDWVASAWRRATSDSGSYRISGTWSISGGRLHLAQMTGSYVLPGGSSRTDTTIPMAYLDTAFQITGLGGGSFRLRSVSGGWSDTVGLVQRPLPAWSFPADADRPTIEPGTGVPADTIYGSAGESGTITVDLADGVSGIDTFSVSNQAGIDGRGFRRLSIAGVALSATFAADAVVPVTIWVRDGAGNASTKTFYFAVKSSVPDFVRTSPVPSKDTTWLKSGTLTVSGNVSSRFSSVYLDSTGFSLALDSAGGVSVALTPTFSLVRHILYAEDDSFRIAPLDTFWLGRDTAAPTVAWVSPAGGVDASLAAGTTSRAVSVTVSDAASGVATVKIGTTSLVRGSGNSWTGTVTGLVTGLNTLSLVATDNLGNAATKTLSLTVKAASPPSVALKNATSGDTLVLADTATTATLQIVVRDKGGRTVAALVVDSSARSTSDSVYRVVLAAPAVGTSKTVSVQATFTGDTLVLRKTLYIRRAVPATAGTFTDARDGHVYKWVRIGSQKWMAENLVYGTQVGDSSTLGTLPLPQAGRVDRYCYDNLATNCAKYGGLYTWPEAMQLTNVCATTICATSVSIPHQGACPSGWHIPTDGEWSELTASSLDSATAGSALKSDSGWDAMGNGVDQVGFGALPGGAYYGAMGYGYAGSDGLWWTASEVGAGLAESVAMNGGYTYVYKNPANLDKSRGFSLRCLEN